MLNRLYLFMCAVLLWKGYHYVTAAMPTPTAPDASTSVESTPPVKRRVKPTYPSSDTSRFVCDGRTHCSQMTSREEAVFFIRNCPNTRMDGDHDGKPCEQQFDHW